jgi:uncharacterized protein DUF3795
MTMNTISEKIKLVAPCGMYCGICDKYLAFSHNIPKKRGRVCHCQGCRTANKNCSFIKKKCPNGNIYKLDFCYECGSYPCDILIKASKKYKNRYHYDFVMKLDQIIENGIEWFIIEQEKIFNCVTCGDMICVHNDKCYTCDKDEII